MLKQSQFNINLNIGLNPIVYNCATRRYALLDEINDEELNKCADKGLVIDSNANEIPDLITAVQSKIANGDQIVTIFPTTNCNARCWYCYEEGISRCDMSQNTIKQTIKFIKQTFNKPEIYINWFGGEPLLNIDAIKQITLALKDAGYILNTCITSNGSLITPELIRLLSNNYHKKSMSITIDAIGKEYGKIKRYKNISSDQAYKYNW